MLFFLRFFLKEMNLISNALLIKSYSLVIYILMSLLFIQINIV